ncbi:helix-turn-helix domain-containing protein [Pseudomonas sp. SWRI100]|uniref:helix-turn-helix domain-containing protein n=1 Tax=Pseudomonas TaxID=286 RepID=UPI001647CD8E|nr:MULTISPECIES: helix-turn-helix transcriptional regulator [Pseudomonas]MBC3495756.1 helix-turn-helix transcriptional regulator [Pseudomonas sp. SWRI67]MBV4526865.1 helix-turn-helix domain-containing protein [Pseudomonas kermanshahensis]
MTLKASFANVLRALRSKRNITQRDFADTTSRTYLSKLELGKSSITLDKLEQISNRLELSPLTLLTLTLSEDTGRSASDLMSKMRAELDELQRDGGLPGLSIHLNDSSTIQLSGRRPPRAAKPGEQRSMQTELAFTN